MDEAAAATDFVLLVVVAAVWTDCGVPGLVQAAAPLVVGAVVFTEEVQEEEADTMAEDVDVAIPLLDGI